MSQCVPSWDNNQNQFTDASYNHHHPPAATKLILSRNLDSNVPNSAPEVPMLDYEVAELTWENGQLGLHGLGQPQIPTWQDKQPGSSGTLESIVNQATCFFNPSFNDKPQPGFPAGDELVPWFNHRAPATSATMTIDALVPLCSNNNNKPYTNPAMTSEDSNAAPDGGGGFTRVESCSAEMNSHAAKRHRRGLRQVPVVSQDRSTRSEYSANSSRIQFTVDTCTERDNGTAFTSTSTWSVDNTSSGMPGTKLTGDDPDSICQSRSIMKDDGERHGENKKKGSSSGKRSRAAAIHNQSERKRRDKINQRMKTLQKLVPNSNKTDKASMLDEVIEYLKQLQAQVNMVNRVNMNMNMPQLMIPMTLNQQALQMSMMGAAMANMPVIHPSAFMHLPPWDHSQAMIPDPMSAFLASQSQPVTIDSYRIMASMYQQQMQQAHQAPNSRT